MNHNHNHALLQKKNWWQKLNMTDGIFAIVVIALGLYVRLKLMQHAPNIYEEIIFWLALPAAILLGWFYKPLRLFIPATLLLTFLSIKIYAGDFANAENRFLLKYFLSGQSAIMWQCFLTILAFVCFLIGALVQMRKNTDQNNTLIHLGMSLSWFSALAGITGLLIRWHESYLIGAETGHMPVSDLYEVFILFMAMISLMFLYYAEKNHLQRLGVFIYALQCILVGFILWYSLARGAQEIRPLIPALQSWWMKIHVPANFIGYGGFCIAAMLAVAELWALRVEKNPNHTNRFLPPSETIEEVMYKSIAIGFVFFTIATILGALWAGDAWGRYWSWDPKETWALIVWLNYAVWLHLRLVAGWRGKVLAWWALIGLLLTTFAFIGVNMFLTGLHSYGNL